MSAIDIFMFMFGCIMSFVGVYFITAGRAQADSGPDSEAEPTEDPEQEAAPLESSHKSDRSTKSAATRYINEIFPSKHKLFEKHSIPEASINCQSVACISLLKGQNISSEMLEKLLKCSTKSVATIYI